jgi:hypothetical protein
LYGPSDSASSPLRPCIVRRLVNCVTHPL